MTFHALLTRANKKKKCIRNGLLGLPSLSPIHCAVEFIKAPPCYRLIQRVAFSMFFVILIFFFHFRQLFEVVIQASIRGKITARET